MAWGERCLKCGHSSAPHTIIKYFDDQNNVQVQGTLCAPCTTLLRWWLGDNGGKQD